MNLVRLGVMDKLPEFLTKSFNIELDSFGLEIGFNFDLFSQPDLRYPLPDVLRLLEQCAEKTGQKHFGALLARAQNHDSLGLIKAYGTSVQTLSESIQSLIDNIHKNATGIKYDLCTEQGFSYLLLHIEDDVFSEQGALFTLTQCYLLFRTLTANKWNPSRLCLKQDVPKIALHAEQLKQMFDITIQFKSQFNGYIFDSAQLCLKATNNERRIFALIQDYLNLSGLSNFESKLNQVKSTIRSRLLSHQICQLQDVASTMHMSRRSLQHYLQLHQITFQQLLTQVRFELACDLLCNSEQSIAQIAENVGFAEIAVFSRSFKKYTGLTPSKYRNPARKV